MPACLIAKSSSFIAATSLGTQPRAPDECVAAGLSKATAAPQFNGTPKTVGTWIERFRAGGLDGSRARIPAR